MTSSNLIRWSGLAALMGGVLLVVLDVVEFVTLGGRTDSAATATSIWFVLQVLYLVAFMLAILALMGLYVRQAERTGTLGLLAFLVAFSGTVMVAGTEWSAAFIGPWLAEVAPELLDTAEPAGAGVFTAGFILTLVLFALGWLLFGLASLQARVLPGGAAVLLMVGAVLVFVLAVLELSLWTVVLGAALAWMGYAVWTGAGEPASTAEAAT
jgi:hypothetical protein